jgi:hypothetical protein
VKYLKNSGIIDTRQIGFYISKGFSDSVMTFGGYDDSMIAPGKESDGWGIHWFDLTGTNWW